MLPANTVLQNRYLIIRQLGKGGMGTVYEALDQRLDTVVALKECHFSDPRLQKQFEREARLLARLRHPAMTKVIDHFSENDGQFLVMEFIPGDDLFGIIEVGSIPFHPGEVVMWADQLLDALEYLHTQDPPIIHRDIKPQNLKLTGRGQIILLDFGLAKGFAGEISRVTESGSIFGFTPNYAPLEQIQGTGTDARSDLYSLAATLYKLMTGVTPPDALGRITAVANEQPDPLRPANELNRLIPQEIAEVLTKAMMQNREKRPANAAEMRKMLHQASQALLRTAPSQAETLLQDPPANRPPRTPGEGSQEDATLRLTDPGGTTPAAPSAKAPGRASLFFRFTRSPDRWTWTIGASLGLLLIGLVLPVLLLINTNLRMYGGGGDSSSLGRPLRVGIVSWPGYAGGIVANNGFKPNKECIFFKNHKLTVEFVLMEDPAVRGQAFAKGEGGVDIVWSTVDYWANELPGFINNGVKARAIMQVDWSRGGDAIVVDQSIKRIEDLKGKRISLVKYTPSHWLLEFSLANSSLSDREQAQIIDSLVEKDAMADVRADFIAKTVDAAVLWEPDLAEALTKRPSSHVLISTRTAQNLIGDIMVAREDFIKAHPDVIKAFIEGWLEGTQEANRDPDRVVRLLMENEPLYQDLGEQTTRAGLQTVKWADLSDNTRMFGLDGGLSLFDRLFKQASQSWHQRGYISQPIAPDQSRDASFLKEIYAAAPVSAPQEPNVAPPSEELRNRPGVLSRHLNIHFASGQTDLTPEAKGVIDESVALLLLVFPNAYIRVEGNTDPPEGRSTNAPLSRMRAEEVAKYLAERYKLNPNRFIVVGNGPDKPLVSNSTPEGMARNRRTDIIIIP
jgi:serine/threonine protein kinase/outer membrane protein OmpA-like peptidoglycan-associated protein